MQPQELDDPSLDEWLVTAVPDDATPPLQQSSALWLVAVGCVAAALVSILFVASQSLS